MPLITRLDKLCRESVPGQLPRLTREQLDAAISSWCGPERLRLGAVDLSRLDLSRMDLHGITFNEWSAEGQFSIGACLQEAYLEGTNLDEADLSCVNCEKARLGYAEVRRAALTGTNLQEASLSFADLSGSILMDANLQRAELSSAKLEGCDLRKADLRGADLTGASLRGADLQRANLSGVNLLDIEAGGLQRVRLYRAKLNKTALRKDDLEPALGEELAGEYQKAREAYLNLKRNFEDLGDYSAASWSYTKERQMEKACSAPWRARRFYGRNQLGETADYRAPAYHPKVWWFFVKHTAKWLGDWLVELICGYGESIPRVLICILTLVFVGSPLLISSLGGITWTTDQINIYFGLPTVWDRFWYVYGVYLSYSFDVFTTASVSGLMPANPAVRTVSGCLTLAGIFLTGLLGFVAGNRIRRS